VDEAIRQHSDGRWTRSDFDGVAARLAIPPTFLFELLKNRAQVIDSISSFSDLSNTEPASSGAAPGSAIATLLIEKAEDATLPAEMRAEAIRVPCFTRLGRQDGISWSTERSPGWKRSSSGSRGSDASASPKSTAASLSAIMAPWSPRARRPPRRSSAGRRSRASRPRRRASASSPGNGRSEPHPS